jgi:hypothetical protein
MDVTRLSTDTALSKSQMDYDNPRNTLVNSVQDQPMMVTSNPNMTEEKRVETEMESYTSKFQLREKKSYS